MDTSIADIIILSGLPVNTLLVLGGKEYNGSGKFVYFGEV
jgi:hypothetical protein